MVMLKMSQCLPDACVIQTLVCVHQVDCKSYLDDQSLPPLLGPLSLQLPSSAIIHAKGTSTALLPPSRLQLQSARASEAARRVLPEHEIEQLKKLRAARKEKKLSQGLNPAPLVASAAVESGAMGGSNDGETVDGGRMVDKHGAETLAGESDGARFGDGNVSTSGAAIPNGDAHGNEMKMGGHEGDSEEEGREHKDWRKQGYVKDKARFKRNFVKVRFS